NYDSLRDNPDVDAVFIVLPNALHAEYTVRAAQAGKHVLCEKPMATTPEDCQRMIDACRSANRKLMIAYRVRYEPYNQTMIAWSRAKKYGDVQFVLSDTIMDVGGAKQWRLDPALSGGGSLIDVGIYSLNATRYLTGEEPAEINALSYTNPKESRFSKVEESIAFQLRFPSGVLANCTSSYGTAQVNRYRVVGQKGWHGLEPATLYRGLQLWHGHDDVVERVHLPEVNHVAKEMDHFAGCVFEDKTPLTPGEEGLKDVRLILKIYEAAKARETLRVT
ncbi:MAG TPA: Gfo/Idh/MocA family oxidoreductase, partial [Myxococcota bacterium]|nr:Gfo/Idh/MocA family oxidoreductase [Myxococcota bacterium]